MLSHEAIFDREAEAADYPTPSFGLGPDDLFIVSEGVYTCSINTSNNLKTAFYLRTECQKYLKAPVSIINLKNTIVAIMLLKLW